MLKLIPPFAKQSKSKMIDHGVYEKGGPKGLLVHFTAGHDGAENTISDGVKNKYTYWCIQRDGQLFCAHEANRWGYHAGESRWNTLLGSVSDDIIGVEMNAAGLLKLQKDGSLKSWFGTTIPKAETRHMNQIDNVYGGYYHVYTDQQIDTLIKTIYWVMKTFPATFRLDNVVGHDEVSGPSGLGKFVPKWAKLWRKNDPGAALPCTMPQFRRLLKMPELQKEPTVAKFHELLKATINPQSGPAIHLT